MIDDTPSLVVVLLFGVLAVLVLKSAVIGWYERFPRGGRQW